MAPEGRLDPVEAPSPAVAGAVLGTPSGGAATVAARELPTDSRAGVNRVGAEDPREMPLEASVDPAGRLLAKG